MPDSAFVIARHCHERKPSTYILPPSSLVALSPSKRAYIRSRDGPHPRRVISEYLLQPLDCLLPTTYTVNLEVCLPNIRDGLRHTQSSSEFLGLDGVAIGSTASSDITFSSKSGRGRTVANIIRRTTQLLPEGKERASPSSTSTDLNSPPEHIHLDFDQT
jgi:hypothetical protein